MIFSATTYTAGTRAIRRLPLLAFVLALALPSNDVLAQKTASLTFSASATASGRDSGDSKTIVMVGGYQGEEGDSTESVSDETLGMSMFRAAGPADGGRLQLGANVPNPFEVSTAIRFTLPDQQKVRLAVYNILGQQVRVLVDGTLGAGPHEATFAAGSFPSGVYFYRLETPSGVIGRRMILSR